MKKTGSYLLWIFIFLFCSREINAQVTFEQIAGIDTGLDSNNVNDGPNTFLLGYRITNTSGSTLTNLELDFNWTTANSFINIYSSSPTTLTLDSLAANDFADFYFTVEITRDANARETSRDFQLDLTSNAISIGNVTGTFTVHSLISQNRNTVVSIVGPEELFIGETYQFTGNYSRSAGAYDDIELSILFPTNIFQLLSVSNQFMSTTTDTIYNDGDLGGGTITSTYIVKVIGSGSATLSTYLTDTSASKTNFHYNSDFSSSANAHPITAAPSGVDPDVSTITADPLTVLINTQTSTITVTLKDAFGNPISGKDVSLTADIPGTVVISAPSGPSDSNGVVTFTVSNSNEETVTFTATDTTDNIPINGSAQVQFVSETGPIDLVNSTVVADPIQTLADTGSSIVTVTIFGQNGPPISNVNVTLTGTGSTIITPISGITNAQGVVQFTVTDPDVEVVTYTATTVDGPLQQTATVNFIAGSIDLDKSTVIANPTTVFASTGSSTVTVTLFDSNDNPVSGQTVTLSGTGSTVISPLSGVTNAQGVVQFTVTDPNVETVIYTATTIAGNLTQQASVNFISQLLPVDPVKSTVIANPTTVLAGTGSSTVTVTLVDTNNVPIPGHTVILTGTGSTIINPLSGVTDSQGVVQFIVTDPNVETATYTATDITGEVVLQDKPSVTFIANVGPIDLDRSTVVANPVSVLSGTGSSIVTVTLFDSNGVPLPNQTVTLIGTGSTVINPLSGVTDSQGVVQFIVTDPKAETVMYTARTIVGDLTQHAFVEFVPPVSPLTSEVAGDPLRIPANGSTQSFITITLRDANGNPVSGRVVQLNALNGNSIITLISPSNISDVNGQVVFAVTDSTTETVIYQVLDITDEIIVGNVQIDFTSKSERLDPPRHLRVKVKKNKFGIQTETIHVLRWNPSKSSSVEGYRIYQNGKLIATVSSKTHKYVFHKRCQRIYKYTIVAFSEDSKSRPVSVKVR